MRSQVLDRRPKGRQGEEYVFEKRPHASTGVVTTQNPTTSKSWGFRSNVFFVCSVETAYSDQPSIWIQRVWGRIVPIQMLTVFILGLFLHVWTVFIRSVSGAAESVCMCGGAHTYSIVQCYLSLKFRNYQTEATQFSYRNQPLPVIIFAQGQTWSLISDFHCV